MNERIDTSKVVTWQYENARTFLKLLEAKEDVANMMVTDSWDSFFRDIFNIDTCKTFGLYLWNSVLGFARPEDVSDDLLRRVVKARFYLLFHGGDAVSYLKYLSLLFDAGEGSGHPERNLYFEDKGDMSFSIVLNWQPDYETMKIIEMEGVFPHPTGVRLNKEVPGRSFYLGFDGWIAYAPNQNAKAKPLTVSPIKLWGYNHPSDANLLISPPTPYYATIGSGATAVTQELKIDDNTGNCYYMDDEGVKQIVVPENDGFGHALTSIPLEKTISGVQTTVNLFYYLVGDTKYVLKLADGSKNPPVAEGSSTGVLWYVDENKNNRSIGYDSDGFYYNTVDLEKVYLKGQHLGNFDLSNFKKKS